MEDAREAYQKDGINESVLEGEDSAKFGKLFAKVCSEATRKFLMEREKQG